MTDFSDRSLPPMEPATDCTVYVMDNAAHCFQHKATWTKGQPRPATPCFEGTEWDGDTLKNVDAEPPKADALDVEKLTQQQIRWMNMLTYSGNSAYDDARRELRRALPSLLKAQEKVELQAFQLNVAAIGVQRLESALLQAQTRLNDLELELDRVRQLGTEHHVDLDMAIEQNQRERERTIAEDRRANEAENALSQAQTERDALQMTVESRNRLIVDKDNNYRELLDGLRAQVSALEASQREAIGKVDSLRGESPDWVSRRSVLDILRSIFPETPCLED